MKQNTRRPNEDAVINCPSERTGDVRAASLQTVSRAIRVLRLLEGGRRALSLTEIAREMELNKATSLRLVQSLVAEGLLVKDHQGRHAISYGLLALGHVLLESSSQAEVARPILEWARDESGETAHFNIREGDSCVVIASTTSLEPVRYTLNIGYRAPLYAGAASLAVLANLPEGEVDRLLAGSPTYPSDGAAVDVSDLKRRLHTGRSQGYLITRGERVREAIGVGVPVFGHAGSVLGAIAVIGPAYRLAQENAMDRAIDVAQEAARRLSRALTATGNSEESVA